MSVPWRCWQARRPGRRSSTCKRDLDHGCWRHNGGRAFQIVTMPTSGPWNGERRKEGPSHAPSCQELWVRTFPQMGEDLQTTTKSRIAVGRRQVRFGYSCSAAGECAAEAVFCYTAENSHHLKAQVTPKNPQFQEEKISERRTRSQVTSEKSSKNYISLFG